MYLECENIIIYEIGFLGYFTRIDHHPSHISGHAESNSLYNGAVLLILWFINCILIMKFDNEQAAISQKICCLCARQARVR